MVTHDSKSDVPAMAMCEKVVWLLEDYTKPLLSTPNTRSKRAGHMRHTVTLKSLIFATKLKGTRGQMESVEHEDFSNLAS